MAVDQAFARASKVFYEKMFDSTFVPKFQMKILSFNTSKNFHIAINNISESELEVVSFNGSRINYKLLVLPSKTNSYFRIVYQASK
jgi:hypothetical protein